MRPDPASQLSFPSAREGELFTTEGGTETEIMFRWGFELPQFAMYPLLDDPEAVEVLDGMYRRYLSVAARHGLSVLLGGLDYRASPDWGSLLGYSAEGLADMQHRSIGFLRDMAAKHGEGAPRILIGGLIGPRGDAYELNRTITAAEAEEYHAVQLATLKEAEVDFACAMTFNNVEEAIGVTRAARAAGVPLILSLSTDGSGRLASGPSIGAAITRIDAETGGGPACYALNCSHPEEFAHALEDADWIERLRGFRPNAAKMEKIALCKLGHLEEGDPPELGRRMGDIARRFPHMDIWGGCCGTGEAHLDEIATNVRAARADLVGSP
jgi:S-methylmethionine-dependent homocysteine/selenocysteine methylase